MRDLVAIGEPLGLFRAEDVGPMRVGTRSIFSFGGAESNVAIGMARLGHSVALAGRVGDDAAGRLISDCLRAEGVDVSGMVVDPDAPTALMVRCQRTADHTTVEYHRRHSAGSRLVWSDVDDSMVRDARILHATGITMGISPSARDTVKHAVKIARQAGRTVSLDINHRSRVWSRRDAAEALLSIVGQVDVLFGSENELAMLTDETEPAAVVAAVAELGPAEVVAKRGDRGALARVGGETFSVPAFGVTPVDPVGAGDAFVAGYLSSRLAGAPPAERLRGGALCGAFAVSVPGDWEGLPRSAELELLSSEDNVVR